LEAIDVANQAKVKLYDQMKEEGPIELGEALERLKLNSRGGTLSKSKTMLMFWMWHING
jgi:hypothetical protein